MTTRNGSLPLTVHLAEGTHDRLTAWLEAIRDFARQGEARCTTYEDLARHRQQVSDSYHELLSILIRWIGTNAHDGPEMHLYPELFAGMIGFRYTQSGLTGGILPGELHGRPEFTVHT